MNKREMWRGEFEWYSDAGRGERSTVYVVVDAAKRFMDAFAQIRIDEVCTWLVRIVEPVFCLCALRYVDLRETGSL